MKEFLGREVSVIMDRPLGSKHPKFDFIYTVNYGYVPNTLAGDGDEIDAYILGVFKPLETYKGTVVAIIERKNDNESKLVVCDRVGRYTKDQIYALTEFVERYFESEIHMM